MKGEALHGYDPAPPARAAEAAAPDVGVLPVGGRRRPASRRPARCPAM
jgi:hypothetical protein